MATTFTLRAPSPSLLDIVPVVECTVCNGTHPDGQTRPGNLTESNNQRGLPGQLAFLPSLKLVDSAMNRESCVYQQIKTDYNCQPLNSNAGKHPCLMLTQSRCGHMVFCAQVTGFQGVEIEAKFSNAGVENRQRLLDEYVAFSQAGIPGRPPHNQFGSLVYRGSVMKEQSYAHLEFGFWIEWRNLAQWGNRRLTADSLSLVTRLYVAAELGRQTFGSHSLARLERAAGGPHLLPTASPSPSPSKAMYLVPPWGSAAIPINPPPSLVRDTTPLAMAKYVSPAKRNTAKVEAMKGNWRSKA